MSGAFMFGAVSLMTMYGYYQIGQTNIERRKVRRETRERRAHILPFLQAEEDVRYNLAVAVYEDEERRIMKDVPGWEVNKNVYNHKEWMPAFDNRPW